MDCCFSTSAFNSRMPSHSRLPALAAGASASAGSAHEKDNPTTTENARIEPRCMEFLPFFSRAYPVYSAAPSGDFVDPHPAAPAPPALDRLLLALDPPRLGEVGPRLALALDGSRHGVHRQRHGVRGLDGRLGIAADLGRAQQSLGNLDTAQAPLPHPP